MKIKVPKKNPIPFLPVVTIFSIAMGFLEAAVVIYLRKIYYPGGFDFPLVPVSSDLLLTEILREAATVIMLLSIGYLAGRNIATRFAWFIYSFAVWDIFYYIFLKLVIGWPESFMTWDILFLIPATWTGPVLSPVILTVLMIILAIEILIADRNDLPVRLLKAEWLLLISGSLVCITAFLTDYCRFIFERLSGSAAQSADKINLIKEISRDYVPATFPWILFFAGVILISGALILFGRRIKSLKVS